MNDMTDEPRGSGRHTFAAFAIAPLMPALSVLILLTQKNLLFGLAIAGVIYLCALGLSLAVGLPLYLLLRALDLLDWWSLALVGVLTTMPLVAAGVLDWPSTAALTFNIAGAVSGLVFWAVWSGGQDYIPPEPE